jgi:metal-responsive CopG/Arc/MetJ family transcriptional regulator
MPRNTTGIRLPEGLVEALDQRAQALGITRSQLIIAAVEQALDDRSAGSPSFLKAIGEPRPERKSRPERVSLRNGLYRW